MFCPNCGQRQVSNGARFCPACGFPLEVVGELVEPPHPSVTDHTTRLLDKQPDETPRQ